MKVLLVNTHAQGGGAAIAAHRLMMALREQGIHANLLSLHTSKLEEGIVTPPKTWKGKWAFYIERLTIWFHNRFSRNRLWYVDIANVGVDITTLPEFRQADIIHLHWINHGFLSLRQLEKIFQSKKKIIWTLHDQWPYTGICHHSESCRKYEQHCENCPMLCVPSEKDLSYQVFSKKKSIYPQANLTFVGCSEWIAEGAKRSLLTQGHAVVAIPNVVPTIFCPQDPQEARKRLNLPQKGKIILFGSCKVSDRRKGADYLIEACRSEKLSDVIVLIVGGHAEWMKEQFTQQVYVMNYIHSAEEMARVYAAADAYITPSLFENLPNTIAESMSVGTPCVGFETGGIPEMISHKKNGYVARYKDVQDLAEGINWVLHHDLREEARKVAAIQYSPSRVATQYLNLYEK